LLEAVKKTPICAEDNAAKSVPKMAVQSGGSTIAASNSEVPRVCTFGSLQPGGANLAMVGGSVRFLKQSLA
jgi:Protein of unknown function (DUF1559)